MARLVPLLAATALLLLWSPTAGHASCAGLTGDALQRCLQGERPDPGARKTVFVAPDGRPHAFDSETISRNIDHVCTTVRQNGLFIAYRSANDQIRDRRWKEVECRDGRLTGLWKEYFHDEEMTTVLFYDASGRAVRQAIYANGRLLKEQDLAPAPKGRARQ